MPILPSEVKWSEVTQSCQTLCDTMNCSLPGFSAAAKSLQLCPTLCDPIDGSPPGSPVPGILQAGTLEWVAISLSSAWKWKVKVESLSRVRLFATSWTATARLLRPWNFPGKSTGVGCHFLLQGIFPTQGSNPGLPHCRQTLYPLSHQGSPYPSKTLSKNCRGRNTSKLILGGHHHPDTKPRQRQH